MSTDFPDEDPAPSGWVSQAEAARIHGVTRQAINKLVRAGRLRSLKIGGHVLVSRKDVEGFQPLAAGRPSSEDARAFERIRAILESSSETTRDQVFDYLRSSKPPHPIESRLGAEAEVILEALNRAGELTIRMFRGVIAEAAFEVHVVSSLDDWRSVPIEGNPAYDFLLDDGRGLVKVQVKLQRSERGIPLKKQGYFFAETWKSRRGQARSTEGTTEKTRPYRYGEFDILAVCMQPSTGYWNDFRYTVSSWLRSRSDDAQCLATLQPVSPQLNDDWTNDFLVCVQWLREGREKRIRDHL